MFTVLDVLKGATDYLEKNGVESARLNAELLLAHVLKKRRLDLYLEFDRPLSEEQRAPLRQLIRDRASGIPLQHLLGSVEFFGREFTSDARGLIPRPETEQLIEMVLAKTDSSSRKALDVGTGSGVIALTLALERPEWSIEASDLSPEALSLAQENALRHFPSGGGPAFHQADLYPHGDQVYDVIVANLPYIPSDEIEGLQREVRHDPLMALDGGKDGLDFIRSLIALAPTKLSPGGLIALESGIHQPPLIAELLSANNFRDIDTTADYQGIERFIFATHG